MIFFYVYLYMIFLYYYVTSLCTNNSIHYLYYSHVMLGYFLVMSVHKFQTFHSQKNLTRGKHYHLPQDPNRKKGVVIDVKSKRIYS